jgi:hypothetical protein
MPSLCKIGPTIHRTYLLPICHDIMKVKRRLYSSRTLDVNWRDIDS